MQSSLRIGPWADRFDDRLAINSNLFNRVGFDDTEMAEEKI